MRPLSKITETVWAPALLAGFFSNLLTVGLHWYWSHYTLIPVFAVGVVVGYYYRHRSKRAIRVGTRAGLVGALPAVWVYSDFLDPLVGIGFGQPVWAVLEQGGLIVLFFLLVSGISALMGFMGTLAGIKTVRHASAATPVSE